MDEELVFNSSYSKLQYELTEAESKLHLARTQRNEAMTRIGELVKELEQCKTPESPETEAERERKAMIADRLGVPPGGFLGPHVMLALDELDHLRSELNMAMQAVKNLEIACEQSEDELKALKAATGGGEVYVTGNGAPLSTIQRMAENQGYSTEPPAMPTPLPSTIEALNFDPPAIAHLSTRPEGLPDEHVLAAIMCEANGSTVSVLTGDDGYSIVARAALTALRPWLRDPVGCELDVHPDQLDLYKWVTEPDGGYAYAAQQALDLCRSRIKPVYECKECDRWEARYKEMKRWHDRLDGMVSDARAALEGE